MPDTPSPRQNRLLAALPATDYEHLSPNLEVVQMPFAEIIHESGWQFRHIYFPTNAVVSLLCVMEDGASAEITGVGNEGMIGIAVFTGGNNHAPSRHGTVRRPCLSNASAGADE